LPSGARSWISQAVNAFPEGGGDSASSPERGRFKVLTPDPISTPYSGAALPENHSAGTCRRGSCRDTTRVCLEDEPGLSWPGVQAKGRGRVSRPEPDRHSAQRYVVPSPRCPRGSGPEWMSRRIFGSQRLEGTGLLCILSSVLRACSFEPRLKSAQQPSSHQRLLDCQLGHYRLWLLVAAMEISASTARSMRVVAVL